MAAVSHRTVKVWVNGHELSKALTSFTASASGFKIDVSLAWVEWDV
jgi:hypothetical protein